MKTLLAVLSVWAACLTVSAGTDELPDTATSALTEESFAVSRVPCYSCGVTSTTTDAGKTFFVTLQRSGLMLMVR